MLEVGWSELLVLAIVAIVVVGPKELPAMLRALGKTIGGLKRTANEFRAQFDEAVRQSELDSMRAEMEDMQHLERQKSPRKPTDEAEREGAAAREQGGRANEAATPRHSSVAGGAPEKKT